jgi:hypothetical protein
MKWNIQKSLCKNMRRLKIPLNLPNKNLMKNRALGRADVEAAQLELEESDSAFTKIATYLQ